MKKLISLLLTLAMLACMLAGCAAGPADNDGKSTSQSTASVQTSSSAKDSATKPDEAVPAEEIILRTTIGPGELFPEQIELFEIDHPNVSVEVVSADTTKLMSMIAAGTAPDYLRIIGVLELPSYVTRGIASDKVDDFLMNRAEYTKPDDLLPIADVYRWDGEQQGVGKLYGLPKDWSNDNGIFINKQLFTDAGIEIPDDKTPLTYSQVGDFAKRIQVMDGNTPKIYGYCHGNGAFYNGVLLAFNAQKGAKPWKDGFNTPDFTNEATREYVDWVLDLARNGASIITPILQAPNNDASGAFLNGQLGMWARGYWYTGLMRTNENTKDTLDNFKFLPAPQPDGSTERKTHCISATGGIILRATNHFEEAAQLLDFHLSGSPASDRAKSGWGLPIYKSMLDNLPSDTEFDKQTAAVATDEAQYLEANINVNPFIAPTTMQALIDKYLIPVLYDKDTAENALESINQELTPLIAEGKEIAGVK